MEQQEAAASAAAGGPPYLSTLLGLALPQLRRLFGWMDPVLEEASLAGRAIYLSLLFTPVVATAPAALVWDLQRPRWAELLRWTLERAGPAFIKWGQWGSSRPDLLPGDVCDSLKHLHSQAPSHGFEYSRRVIEAALGRPLGELFASIDERPLASGSIAQIHVATLSAEGARVTGREPGEKVAVKARGRSPPHSHQPPPPQRPPARPLCSCPPPA